MPTDDLAVTRTAHDSLEEGRIVAVLRTGVHATNARTAEQDHWMCLVEGPAYVRLLSYPEHPATRRRPNSRRCPRGVRSRTCCRPSGAHGRVA